MKNLYLLFTISFLTTTLNAQWTQRGIDIDGEAAVDQSGYSVSLSSDGNTMAVGAHLNDGIGIDAGHVRVYQWDGSAWVQQGTDIDGEAAYDLSGTSVSLSSDGNTLAIGAPNNAFDAGHVRVYQWDGANWAQVGSDIDAQLGNSISGKSVSLSDDGNTVAIGAPNNSASGVFFGHVQVYQWDGANWAQVGSDLSGEADYDYSGWSVSLSSDGNTVAIGAAQNDGVGIDAGHVRVYQWDGSAWVQQGTDIDGEAAGDLSGHSVSLSSDGITVAIGAPGNVVNSGQVRVYQWDGSAWVQQGTDIDGGAGDALGWSVSLSGDGFTLAAGLPNNSGSGFQSGSVQVYQWDGTGWVQQGIGIDGEAASDQSGWSVSLGYDGSTVAIGAPNNDGTANAAGHVRVYSFCTIPTSAYNATICANESITINGTVYNAANPTGTEVFTNIGPLSCDSTVNITLTALPAIDVTTNVSGLTITANNTGVSYQWIDCANGNAPIVGETNASLTATSNGDYAAIITDGTCSDTSACTSITTVGITENDFANQLRVYPNPTKGDYTIDLGDNYATAQVRLVDLTGSLIEFNNYTNSQFIHVKSDYSTGVYFLVVESENKKAIVRLVVD